MEKPSKIAPAKGKLGILLPGMGAVSTTFMAGVELIRKGKSQPVGSLTQMGTIRLGKRTDARSDRKSTRLNSSHPSISYAVFCLKKKKRKKYQQECLHR